MRNSIKELSVHSPSKENFSNRSRWRLNFGNNGILSQVQNVNGSADEIANDIENQRSALQSAAGQIINQNNLSPEKYGGTEIKPRFKQRNAMFEVVNQDNNPQTPIKRSLFAIQKP